MSGARTWLLTSLLVLTGCEDSSIETPSGMTGLRIDTLLGESDAAAIAAAAQPPSPERAEGQQQRVTRVTLPPVDDGD